MNRLVLTPKFRRADRKFVHAIEFEAVAQHHTLRLPGQVPDGVRLRVLVLMEEGSHDPEVSCRPSTPWCSTTVRRHGARPHASTI